MFKYLVLFITIFLSSHALEAQYVPDLSFDQDGFVRSNESSTFSQQAWKMITLDDNSILVLGVINNVQSVWKLDEYGALDNSFGINGIARDSLGINIALIDIKTAANGDIVLLGFEQIPSMTNHPDSSKISIALVKFTQNGILDLNFGNNGLVLDKPAQGLEFKPYGFSLDKRPNGDDGIYVTSAAIQTNALQCNIAQLYVTKYQLDGSPMTSFANNGILTKNAYGMHPNALNMNVEIKDQSFRPDGTLFLTGYLNAQDSIYFAMSLTQNGSMNSNYSSTGFQGIKHLSLASNVNYHFKILDNGNFVVHYETLVSSVWRKGIQSFDYYGQRKTNFGSNGSLLLTYLDRGTVFASNNNIRYIGGVNNNSLDYAVYSTDSNGHSISSSTFNVDTNGVFAPYYGPTSMNALGPAYYSANDEIFFLSNFYTSDANQNFECYFLLNKLKWGGQSPLATTDLAKEATLILYPNPISENQMLHIKCDEVLIKIDIVNSQGQIVFSSKLKNDKSDYVSIPSLAAGTYYARIESVGHVQTKNIFVK